MTKTKILFLLSNFKAGGAETQYANLIRNIDRNKFEPVLGLIEYKKNLANNKFLKRFGKVQVVKFTRVRTLDFSVIFKVASFARKNNIDLIQTLLFMDNQFGRLAGLVARIKVMTSVRGEIGPLLGKVKFRFEIIMQYWSHRVIVNSEWLKRYLVENGANAEKVTVIYNGIDFERYQCIENSNELKQQYGIPVESNVVTMVARLHPMKDHITYLKAIKTLRDNIPSVIALVVGDGDERKRLEEFVKNNQLEDNVRFLGSVGKQLSEIYKITDVLVLSSQWGESFPNVILEAMSASVPVVASNISAIPEIIENGINGYMVKPKSADVLSGYIITLISNKELRADIVSRAKKTSAEFGVPKMVKKYEDMYMSLVQKKAR